MPLWLQIILAPLISMFVVQSIKLATDGIKGNFTVKDMFTAYGGMPSSHTAVVSSLCAMVAYKTGINSAAFAVAFVFSVIVISDAITLRQVVDNNSNSIRKLVSKLPASEQKEYPENPRDIKHTVPQVLVGGLLGFIIAFILHLF
jgi:uncharacterized protein